MGLLSTEVLGGLSSTISGYDVLDVASVKEFSKIIRKIIPEKLEEKYVRLEILIGRYRDIVREMESNNKDINIESRSEETSKRELEIFLKRIIDLEKEFIENEKAIAAFPFTDTTNRRNELLNRNYNLYTQRINLQKKITNIQFKMNKNLFLMNSINKTSDELMSEIAGIVSEMSEVLVEISELSVKGTRLDSLIVAEIQKKQVFNLVEQFSNNNSIEEIKEKFTSLIFFVLSYLELRKSEYMLVKKTAEEIESKYKDRELMTSNNESFNLLRANKILTAPIFISDNILDIFSFNIKNKKNTIQDNNMLSEAFMIMSKLLNSKIEDSYSVDKTVSSIEKMREFKPKNITVGSLISNSARNLERLELEEKKKKSI